MSFICARAALAAALHAPRASTSFRPLFASSSLSSLPHITQPQTRNFHCSLPCRKTDESKTRNKKIPYDTIILVDPETNKLTTPQPLAPLLASVLKERKNFLQVVAHPNESPEGIAIVRLINKKEAAEKEREGKKKQREMKKHHEAKEVQLTWNAQAGDLMHKMKKVREAIEKGMRVELVMATKQGKQVTVSPEEMGKKTSETVQMVEDIAREWRPRHLTRRMTIVYLQEKWRPLPVKSPFYSADAVAANAVAIPPNH